MRQYFTPDRIAWTLDVGKASRRNAAMIWTSAIAATLLGCGRPAQTVESKAPNTGTKQSVKAANIPRSQVQDAEPLILTGHQSIEDLDQGNWQTEQFSRSTDIQLKKFAELFSATDPSQDDLAEIVLSQLTVLAPTVGSMREVYRDGEISVARPAGRNAQLQYTGQGQLASWLRSLIAVPKTARETHLKFKTFGVDLTHDARTTVRMQLEARFDDRIIQASANWKCRWSNQSVEKLPQLKSLEVTDLERIERSVSTPLFADCTESILGGNESFHEQLAYGLDHWLHRLELYDGIIATSYHGLAVGDVNNDGLDDLYVCQPGGAVGGLPNRLFIQQPNGKAVDSSADSGVDWLIETHSALFVDLNNDGNQDLVVATVSGLIFAENDGAGHFTLRLHKLTPEAPAISIAAADYDNDGDVDVYACSYGRRAAADIMGRPVPYHDANNGARNVLFRNDRDWRFVNITKRVGLEQNNTRFSLACAWEDVDNDGDQDLYVANDFGRNSLYRNDNGRFVDIAAEAKVQDMSAGMSVAWGDYDNNGQMDLYVSNMWSSAGNRIAYQKQFLTPDAKAETLAGFRRHARGNSLFRNISDDRGIQFDDISIPSNTTMGGWAWSSSFADINNDGWEDLIVANGYFTQDDPHDM